MLFEPDAPDNLIAPSVDLIEGVPIDYCIYIFLLALPKTVYCPVCLIHHFWLATLGKVHFTLTFQVRIVPSQEPLIKRSSSTYRFVTFFVWPMNSFNTSPSFVQFQWTIVPSSKLPNNVFSVKQAETSSSFTCTLSSSYYITKMVLSSPPSPQPRKQLLPTSLPFPSAFCRGEP